MSSPAELQYYYLIFLKGFWLILGCNLVGLVIRIVRGLKRRGPDVID